MEGNWMMNNSNVVKIGYALLLILITAGCRYNAVQNNTPFMSIFFSENQPRYNGPAL